MPHNKALANQDMVNSPQHYGGANNPYEVIKVLFAWGLDKSFCLGNVVKYVSRAGKKDSGTLLEDLRKAAWYLNYEIQQIEAEQYRIANLKKEER